MSVSVAPLGPARLLAVLALCVAVLGVAAAPAGAAESATEGAAAEEHGPAPDIDEIGEHNDIANQYRPEPAEHPPFMRVFYIPLIIGGFLIAGMLLFMYLTWQPRFAEERRSKRRR